ncbi:MAG: hypothetical protein COY58_00310 [Gammaproteobacteria bacterium CG_4_10_14_0_8_um_filter_38_16]|nr:MAG: hypothetical protein COY58_00310 [Gammaproteobacteria bacterium CG_4_10_14_0_8_um_filter_38_16]PJA02762.1 MAG: hypothetical protein COX72_08205 [Gammaproteobacteria bacterium CG_4_10_14_0_2_um_filter_38_22]PJB10414.1 MAG: hypothetical protein CO120_04995 [Gammaproteobacteria bacterium CG_4_9_14_3_um_filter_38_9]
MQIASPFSIQENNTFDLSNGFLPKQDPISCLPLFFSEWETMVHELPKLSMTNQLRETILSLPDFDVAHLKTEAEFERAMLILSYLAHAYVWHDQAADRLPAILAKPWVTVAHHIGRPAVLSYATYALYNWYRFDKQKPIALGNIALLQNFLGGADEEWFILIHVEIEAHARPALNVLLASIVAAKNNNMDALITHLSTIATALKDMCNTLDRMPEHCDPYIYYNRVRPYIHGWKDNPALPNGLIYEGVSEKPFFYKGETGAQSTIIPCFDALLCVQHINSPLKKHLDEMQQYMPPTHRAFLSHIAKESTVRDFVLNNKNNIVLRDCYNACITLIMRFRRTHMQYAAHYIQKQAQTSIANSTSVGTGGTPFMDYLKKHWQETENQIIK